MSAKAIVRIDDEVTPHSVLFLANNFQFFQSRYYSLRRVCNYYG